MSNARSGFSGVTKAQIVRGMSVQANRVSFGNGRSPSQTLIGTRSRLCSEASKQNSFHSSRCQIGEAIRSVVMKEYFVLDALGVSKLDLPPWLEALPAVAQRARGVGSKRLLGSADTRQLPISSRIPTSRCRFASADRRGQDRELHPATGHAARGTRTSQRCRPHLQVQQRVQL